MQINKLLINYKPLIVFNPIFSYRLERSTDQVIKPINTEALTKWVGQLPEDVVRDMPTLAPMLVTLGYDPMANPPNYGEPDALVVRNTWGLKANKELWAAKEKVVADKRQKIWQSWLKPTSSVADSARTGLQENGTSVVRNGSEFGES